MFPLDSSTTTTNIATLEATLLMNFFLCYHCCAPQLLLLLLLLLLLQLLLLLRQQQQQLVMDQDQKTMTATDVTGFYAVFLRPEIGQFSPHPSGHFLTKLHRKPGEKGKKPLEKIQKNPEETAPRNCRFLSLVVVERVEWIVYPRCGGLGCQGVKEA